MDNTPAQNEGKKATRHYGIVMAFAVLCLGVGLLMLSQHINWVISYVAPTTPEITKQATTTSYVSFPRSEPTRLRIPAIHTDVPFEEPLGLNADKTIEAPRNFDDVGWYQYGATPGETGPAVVLGHVDTYKGAAVFYLLGQLKEGDPIYIDRADGTTVTFVVTELHRYLQSDFPTQLVYGPTAYPALRLITCTGVYDHGVQRYDHNLVVYATLKENTPSSVVENN